MVLSQNLVLGVEGLELPSADHGDMVDGIECARPLSDDHHDSASRAHTLDGCRQRGFAFRIEVGVGLIQHDEKRIAVKGAGERDALALSGRERCPVRAHLGLVSVRQPQDHLVHAGCARGGNNDAAFGIFLEAADVLGDRALEQLNVLRQVADVPTELLARPAIKGRAIEANVRLSQAARGPSGRERAWTFPPRSGR